MWKIAHRSTPFGLYNADHLDQNLLTFHKNPNLEDFNKVLAAVGDLYEKPVSIDIDDNEEKYVQFADETPAFARDRIKELRIAEKTKFKPKIKYSNPALLAFIYAVAKKYPYLAEECSRPLVIERAILFYERSYLKLVYRLQLGPGSYISKDLEVADGDIGVTEWKTGLYHFLDQTLMMYAATGDEEHLTFMAEISLAFEGKDYRGVCDRSHTTRGAEILSQYDKLYPGKISTLLGDSYRVKPESDEIAAREDPHAGAGILNPDEIDVVMRILNI